jgi:hypothetical protein
MERDITKQDIIDAIQDLARKKGRNWLTRLEFQAESAISQHQFSKHFERWNDAVLQAGLHPLDKTGRPDQPKGMTKEHVIQSALRVSDELGRKAISEVEGLKVELEGVTPKLKEITPQFVSQPEEPELKPLPPPDFLNLKLEPGLGEILADRWDQAQNA